MNSDKIENFWKWFIANEQQIIEAVERESATEHFIENLDNLILDMGMFTWEIGPGKINPWVLTISPNGDKDLIKVSQKIMEEAPNLKNWEFNYSKPAKDWNRKFVLYDDNMDEQHIDASQWNYVALKYDDGMIDLILEAHNIEQLDSETSLTAADLLVVGEIGEETKIDWVLSIEIVNQLESEHASRKTHIQNLRGEFGLF